MPLADPSHPSARPSSRELQQLWDAGQRAPAIRGALDAWESLLAKGDDLRWLERALRSSGLPAEASAVQARMARQSGTPPGDWEAFIASVLNSGDPWWARELLAEVSGDSRALQTLRIEADLALGSATATIDDWVRQHRDEAALAAAVAWWVRAGRLDDAERLAETSADLALWRARFALWRRQPERARSLLERLPLSPEVRCQQAVAALQQGQPGESETLLRPLLESEVRAEAWGWLATALRKQARYAEAVRAADTANSLASDFNLALRMERELSVDLEALAARPARSGVDAARRISDLRHAWAVYALGLRPDDSVLCLEGLLDRVGGNHTPHVTTSEDGGLTAHRLPPDPGQLGPCVQRVLWTRGPQAVRALYRALAPSVDAHPSFRIYEGEFELWMGAYDDAARIFRAALDREPSTKWAWIGLGASVMLQGDRQEAQRIWAKGLTITMCAGPTLYVYRGECYRRQGDIQRARADLELAVREKPQRLSGWINLALLDDAGEALRDAEAKCAQRLPLLMQELSGSLAERLENVLEAMRGNRSSTAVSYHLWNRVWSAV
jgi:tetratricopeptide (TPR) repeat protein